MFGKKYSRYCCQCRKEFRYKNKQDYKNDTKKTCLECGGLLSCIPPCPVRIPMPPAIPPKEETYCINEEMISIPLSEYNQLKEQSTCGCGICLAHNNMRCPKIKLTPKERDSYISFHREQAIAWEQAKADMKRYSEYREEYFKEQGMEKYLDE